MNSLHAFVCRISSQAITCGLLLFSTLNAQAADEPLTLSLAGHEYPPLMTSTLPYGGLLTRIVTEALAVTGISLKIEYVPNNRAIGGLMMGIYDGSFGWAHSPERDQKLLYSSNSIYTFRMVFFQRRNQQYPWTNLADLHSYRIGATLGDHYSDEFSALEAKGVLHVDYANDDSSNMKKLMVGRIDLFPMEETSGEFLVKGLFPQEEQSKIVFQSNAIWTVPTYFVIRRDYPKAKEIIERFDRGYRQLAQSGELARLMDETMAAAVKSLPPPKKEDAPRH
jgi:polar amino acid transport system substrate-binding protein